MQRVRLEFSLRSSAGLGLPLEMAESEIPPLPTLSKRYPSATTKHLTPHHRAGCDGHRSQGQRRTVFFSLRAEPLSCQPRASGAAAALWTSALPFPGSCFLLQILVGGIWITTHNFDGNLLWFLFSLRLLNINSNCICFLKQLASTIVLPFVHQ